MRDKLKGAIIAVAAIAALACGGAAIAGATGGKDDGSGKPITGSALDRATSVALNHTGGGRVTGTELNDEEGAYEGEVTRADGSQVDVHLDSAFQVIGDKADSDKGSENGGKADGDQGGENGGKADGDQGSDGGGGGETCPPPPAGVSPVPP